MGSIFAWSSAILAVSSSSLRAVGLSFSGSGVKEKKSCRQAERTSASMSVRLFNSRKSGNER
jgi:hypothetical protein